MSHVRELEYTSLLESPLIELLAEDEISRALDASS
jgi:hypothetical protein